MTSPNAMSSARLRAKVGACCTKTPSMLLPMTTLKP